VNKIKTRILTVKQAFGLYKFLHIFLPYRLAIFIAKKMVKKFEGDSND
jgi:hypothetical protein